MAHLKFTSFKVAGQGALRTE